MTLISYAQNLEDIVLWRALQDVERGFYIDVGAYDPVEDSVTKLFYDRGWRGINVEPVEAFLDRFRRDRPEDLNLGVAIAPRAGLVTLYEIGGADPTGLSTIDTRIAEGHTSKGWGARPMTLAAITLNDLLASVEAPDIHFLKIDIEGAEEGVITSTSFSERRPWILAVEATAPASQTPTHAIWQAHLESEGYEFVYFDGLNRFFVARERAHLRDRFATPPNLFDGFKTATVVTLEHQLAEAAARMEALARERDEAQSRAATERADAEARIEAERQSTEARVAAERKALEAARAAAEARATGERKAADEAVRAAREEGRSIVARLERDLAAAHQEIALLRSWNAAYSGSASWKMTMPLRKASTVVRVLVPRPSLLWPLVRRNMSVPAPETSSALPDTGRQPRVPIPLLFRKAWTAIRVLFTEPSNLVPLIRKNTTAEPPTQPPSLEIEMEQRAVEASDGMLPVEPDGVRRIQRRLNTDSNRNTILESKHIR